METATVVAGFVAMAALFGFIVIYLQGQWQSERAQLLDRIMARNYEEFANVRVEVQSAQEKAHAPINVIPLEDVEKRITESQAGIPL